MLTFVKVIDAPQNGGQNYLANQPDNKLYQHYVSDQSTAWQVNAQISFADYDALSWITPPEVCMTPREVSHIGVKTFPQLGAVGFYRLKYRDVSTVVVPLHPEKTDKTTAPVLSAVYNEDLGTISYTITPGQDDGMTYECYRIELECGDLVVSHVVYELSGEFKIPEQKGTFLCYAIGYTQEGQICSKDSNVISLELPGRTVDKGAEFATHQELTAAIDTASAAVDNELENIKAAQIQVVDGKLQVTIDGTTYLIAQEEGDSVG